MDNRIEILRDLDWQYWSENCSWSGNQALNRPMEIMKRHLEKKGYVEGAHIKSCDELIHMIRDRVDRVKTNDKYSGVFGFMGSRLATLINHPDEVRSFH